MELKSNKYKKRLAIICIILIISTVLGVIAKNQVKEYANQIDEIAATIQSIPEEEYAAGVENANEGENVSDYDTKEEVLAVVAKWQEFYDQIFNRPEIQIIMTFALAFSGSIIGIMMYYIFTGWILNKIWPDLQKWMSILMRILILIILFAALYQILIIIGLFGQLPFAIYTLYKFIKTKKAEEKDDVIVEK